MEHFTAVEFYNNNWHLYTHLESEDEEVAEDMEIPAEQTIYQTLLRELTFENIIPVRS